MLRGHVADASGRAPVGGYDRDGDVLFPSSGR